MYVSDRFKHQSVVYFTDENDVTNKIYTFYNIMIRVIIDKTISLQ